MIFYLDNSHFFTLQFHFSNKQNLETALTRTNAFDAQIKDYKNQDSSLKQQNHDLKLVNDNLENQNKRYDQFLIFLLKTLTRL